MKKTVKLKQIMSIILALVPILDAYLVGPTSISGGDAALAMIVLISGILCLSERKKLSNCYFLFYYVVSFLVACISVIAHGWNDLTFFFTYWIRISVFIIVVDIAAKRDLDYLTLRKWLVYVGLFVSLIQIAQVVFNTLFNIQLIPYVRSLRVNYTMTTEQLIARNTSQKARFCSVFLEPAHFAQYTLLCLVVTLFGSREFLRGVKRVCIAGTMTAAIFLCRSANGIFLCIPVLALFFWQSLHEQLSAQKVVLFFVLLLGVVVFLTQTSFLSSAWKRVKTVTETTQYTTGNLRLLNGFYIFGNMSTVEKLFGFGFGNNVNYFQHNSAGGMFGDAVNAEYMNGLCTLLTSSGLVGLAFYAVIWAKVYRESGGAAQRMAFFVITVLYFTSALFNSDLSAVYIVFIRCMDQKHLECRSAVQSCRPY